VNRRAGFQPAKLKCHGGAGILPASWFSFEKSRGQDARATLTPPRLGPDPAPLVQTGAGGIFKNIVHSVIEIRTAANQMIVILVLPECLRLMEQAIGFV